MRRNREALTEFDVKPYIKLWAAVMSQAASDIRAMVKRRKSPVIPDPTDVEDADLRNTIRWITSAEKRPGSFLWCCDLFDMNPDYVLQQVVRARPTGAVKKLIEAHEEDY